MAEMTLAQLQAQSLLVLGLCFGVAFVWGVLVHRSHFCTMGAISDVLLMGDARRLRQWGLAVAVAIFGFGWMSAVGWLQPMNTIYAGQPLNVLNLGLGGTLFGVGMVLGSGCTSKNLVRLGAGNLKSLVVLLVMGVVALATMRGWLAVVRVQVLDGFTITLPAGPFAGQWVQALTAWSLGQATLAASALVVVCLLLWVFKEPSFRRVSQFGPGAATGLVVLAVWWISGVLGFVPEHPETLEPVFLATASGRMESWSLTAPVAYGLDAFMYFSDGSKRMSLGMALMLGLLAGAWASALQQGTFRWEGFGQTADLTRHIAGGALMGLGGVMGLGCSIGQGLSGLSTLSGGSFVTVLGMALGAVLTLQWQLRRA